jgi:hypothetical protein
MSHLGIQQFKHFIKAGIVSNGIPPFGYQQTTNQTGIMVFDTCLDVLERLVDISKFKVSQCQPIWFDKVKA